MRQDLAPLSPVAFDGVSMSAEPSVRSTDTGSDWVTPSLAPSGTAGWLTHSTERSMHAGTAKHCLGTRERNAPQPSNEMLNDTTDLVGTTARFVQ